MSRATGAGSIVNMFYYVQFYGNKDDGRGKEEYGRPLGNSLVAGVAPGGEIASPPKILLLRVLHK